MSPDSKKRRVLHLITGLNVGGAETVLLRTLPKLLGDFELHVASLTGDGPIGERLREAGVPVTCLNLQKGPGAVFRFRSLIRSFRPDILETYLIHSDLFGRFFGRLFGIRTIVCSEHGSLQNWEWLRRFDRLSAGLVTKYVVLSKTEQERLMRELALPASRFAIIPNSVDTAAFPAPVNRDELRTSLGLPKNSRIAICVANLIPGKGHDYLLEAFDKAAENHADLWLLLAGEGSLRPQLEGTIASLKHGNRALLLGRRSDVPALLAASDVFVFPSLAEGMSMAVLEAMASGLPCVVSDIPANKELVRDGAEGRLFPVGDAKQLAAGLDAVMSDPEAARRLGAQARATAKERYSPEEVIAQHVRFLNAL